MMQKSIQISYQVLDKNTECGLEITDLIDQAKAVSKKAYAPYSNFNVGAAIQLANGEIITGNNQENVAFPSGLCAERSAAFYAKSQYPNETIESIAITAFSESFEVTNPITPCGSCRQALLEYENQQESSIKVIMTSVSGETVYIVNSIKDLLPFCFNEDNLRKDK